MPVLQTQGQSQGRSQNQAKKAYYCKVERSSGVVKTHSSCSGSEWCHVNDAGVLKRFSQYQNACGHKLYQNGKPWGEWKDVEQNKVLYLYSGEKGFGVYDADGELLKKLSKLPAQKGIVTSDLFDSKGNRIYHSHSQSFNGSNNENRNAIIQVGPPPNGGNYDSMPNAAAQQAYDANPSASPSPSDLPARQLRKIESEYKPIKATVIVGEFTNSCGREMYRFKEQNVWEHSGADTSAEGAPSIEISPEDIKAGRKEGEYTIVENKHGIFRVKDGVVERKAVVKRENWTAGQWECRCVPVRCGLFRRRVRYRSRSVWVERSYSAVRLGWVSDPAVGIKKPISKGFATGSGNRNGFGRGPGKGPGVRPSSAPKVESTSPFAPASIPSLNPKDRPIAQPKAIKGLKPLSTNSEGRNPLEINPQVPLAKEEELDSGISLPRAQPASKAPELKKPDIEITELQKSSEPKDTPEPIKLPQTKTKDIDEEIGPKDLSELKPIKEKKESASDGSAIDPMPLEKQKPSITDSANGNPNAIPIQPWTPAKLPEIEQEKVAKKEEPAPEKVPPIQLDSIVLPQRPQRQHPARMAAVLKLVGILDQVGHYADAASRAVALPPGVVDRDGYTRQDYVNYVAVAKGEAAPSYDRLRQDVRHQLNQLDKSSTRHTWFSKATQTLDDGHTKILQAENLGGKDGPRTMDLYQAVTDNHQAIQEQLDGIFNNGEMNLDRLIEWAENNEDAQRFYGDQIEQLREYRFNGSFKKSWKEPNPGNNPAQPPGVGPMA